MFRSSEVFAISGYEGIPRKHTHTHTFGAAELCARLHNFTTISTLGRISLARNLAPVLRDKPAQHKDMLLLTPSGPFRGAPREDAHRLQRVAPRSAAEPQTGHVLPAGETHYMRTHPSILHAVSLDMFSEGEVLGLAHCRRQNRGGQTDCVPDRLIFKRRWGCTPERTKCRHGVQASLILCSRARSGRG